MINVKFTDRVGVAPGTTTMALNGDGGPCLPDPRSAYMTHSGTAAIMSAPAAPDGSTPPPHAVATVPYGTESALMGAPFGWSWPGFLALVAAGVAAGVGLAVLARR